MEDIQVQYYKKLYIEESKINGKGLFAGEDICMGELVLRFGGILVPLRDRYSGKYLSSTFVEIAEDIALCEDRDSVKDFSDYINHSCNPNVGMYDSITLISIKNIFEGEEICCDYSYWEANRDWKLKVNCSCGEANCRKFITGMDWKNVSSNDFHFRYYSPFIRRRILEYEQVRK